jgi:hypothetical protein
MVDAKPEEIKQAEGLLKDKITKAGADQDQEIIKVAQDLLDQVKEQPGGQEIINQTRLFVTWYGSIGRHKSTKSLSGKRLN